MIVKLKQQLDLFLVDFLRYIKKILVASHQVATFALLGDGRLYWRILVLN